MARTIEIRESLNTANIEKITRRANEMSDSHRIAWVEKAMRIVRDREPTVMKVLERGAEIMGKVNESQHGRTQRDKSNVGNTLGSQATDTSLWQEAYRLADEGKPSIHFGWIYAAAAEHTGFRF